jgi:hypothetical protein
MSLRLSCLALSLALAACGGNGDDDADDAPGDAAVDPNRVPLSAWEETGDQVFEPRTLDVSCLGTPTDDMVRTQGGPNGSITLNTTVTDFQSGDLVPDAMVVAFAGENQADVLGMATSDANGNLSIAIDNHPTEPRIGFRMEATDTFPTFLLQQYLQPTGTPQTSPSSISTVSFATGAALPALVGITRSPNTGVLAGAIRDCMGNEIAGFNATVSSTAGAKTPLTGARTFYFGENGLPARNTVQAIGNKNGLFVVLELPPTTTAYVQMWGYLDQAAVDAGTETLLSELAVPVIADNIITGSYELNRTN